MDNVENPVYKERKPQMEKYRYSNLTDDQHKKIVQRIEEIKTLRPLEAGMDAKFLNEFLWNLESMSFICPAERMSYQNAIKEAMKEREAKKGAPK